jgi:hypothetical protein
MSEIVSTVVLVAHATMNVDAAVQAFSSTYVQTDLRNLPHSTPTKVASAAINSFRGGEDNVIYLPLDADVINQVMSADIPVTLLMPTTELHAKLTGKTSIDRAYDLLLKKFNKVKVTHRVSAELPEQNALILLHNIFNSDKFGF